MEFSTLRVDQAATGPSIEPHSGLDHSPIPSSRTTPSCTPLPLELHIDEDGCSALTHSCSSTVVVTSSRSLRTVDGGGSVVSEVSHVKSSSVSNAVKPPSQSVSAEGGSSSAPKGFAPVLTAQSPSQSDFKGSGPAPASKRDSPVLVGPSPDLMAASPVTAPRLSSPVPVSDTLSAGTPPNNAGPETVPKSASPVPVPRLSSPVPKISNLVSAPNVSNSPFEPDESRFKSLSKNTVQQPRLSSPVTVPKSEAAIKSPALVTRKTYTFAGLGSPTGSPVQPAVVQSGSPISPPSSKQGSKIIDLTWPRQDPLLDRAQDKFLSPDSAHLRENQPAASVISADEDRAWEEEDGFYPDFSREGTLTPMTESSWMDECFTPSTCPGTPDATLDLPTQQLSAVERLSASGQVGSIALTLPK